MNKTGLLAVAAAGSLVVPMFPAVPAASAHAGEVAIKSILVRPEAPVVGPTESVRLVIDVVAKGVEGKKGVSIKVEPGTPAQPAQGPDAGPPRGEVVIGPAAPGVVAPTPSPQATSAQVTPSPTTQSPTTQPPAGQPQNAQTAPAQGSGSTMRLGEGWETWRFLPSKGLTRFYPSGTWTVTATARGAGGRMVTARTAFDLRHETRLTGLQADKVRGEHAVRLQGLFTRVDPVGYVDYSAFAGQRLEVFYRRESTGPWERVAETTTGKSGRFSVEVAGRTRGYWRLRYEGTAHYAPEYGLVQRSGPVTP
jgi:hypothetical protein